jgi:Leucine-rich repeat (LRR) protein
MKCTCNKKALFQPLYTVTCSHLNLQDTFPDLEQWPEYAQQKGTHMAVNFDWNDNTHLQRFPNIPGIVSLSLKHNNMVKIAGSAFVDLDNLKALDLSYNQLTGNYTKRKLLFLGI